jgi:hypothetical protein
MDSVLDTRMYRDSRLKPCPWCGGEAVLYHYPIVGYDGHYQFAVKCHPKNNCKVRPQTPPKDDIYRSSKAALTYVVKAWNDRKE